MSLVRTLAKVAAGVVVAKAVKGMVGGGQRGGSSGSTQASSGGGLDDLLGQVLGGRGGASSGTTRGGSLQDMLGQVLAGRAGPAAGSRDGSLGAELEKLSRMSRPGGDAGGAETSSGSFGDKLNQSLEHFGEPNEPPTRDEEDLAAVLLRAMIQAAKADGRIDADEKSRLLERLGDVSQEELDFVNEELKRDVSPDDLASSVPAGAEQQVYMLSAMAIDLDENSEARYLHDLARGLQLNEATVNAIHDRLGLPRIYR
jgi:uncharacterized membrane protein YebE (DUF533 family)